MAIQAHFSFLTYSTVNQTLISIFLPSSDGLGPPCHRFGGAKSRRLECGGGSLNGEQSASEICSISAAVAGSSVWETRTSLPPELSPPPAGAGGAASGRGAARTGWREEHYQYRRAGGPPHPLITVPEIRRAAAQVAADGVRPSESVSAMAGRRGPLRRCLCLAGLGLGSAGWSGHHNRSG